MRNTLLMLITILFSFSNCKKNPDKEPGGNYFGYGKAKLNGVDITFNKVRGFQVSVSADTIAIALEKWDGLILKESYGFIRLINQTNLLQRLHRIDFGLFQDPRLTSVSSTLRDDGEVLCAFYHIYVPDSLQNNITITSYNAQTKEVKGIFNATYLIDNTKCRASAPDTLRITNGEFYTKIFN